MPSSRRQIWDTAADWVSSSWNEGSAGGFYRRGRAGGRGEDGGPGGGWGVVERKGGGRRRGAPKENLPRLETGPAWGGGGWGGGGGRHEPRPFPRHAQCFTARRE